MPNKPKIIFVGPEKLGEVLAERRKNWDFQAFAPNIPALWEGLRKEEISNDVQAVITVDKFFDQENPDNNDFEQLITSLAPYCFVGILQYEKPLEEIIQERIANISYQRNGDSALEYYFIDPSKFNSGLDTATSRYINNNANSEDNEAARDNARVLAGLEIEEEEAEETEPEKETTPVNNTPKYDKTNNKYLGRVVAVTSSKGGSGKSTIALSLGTYLAHASVNSVREKIEKRPLKVMILDIDVRDGQIGFLTGNIRPSILHMRTKGISDESLKETVIHSKRLKVDLLLAPKRARLADEIHADFFGDLIEFLRTHYDYVILDTSVNYLDPLLEKIAYPMADQIVFVTDIVVHSVYSMTRWIQEVTSPRSKNGMGIPMNKIGIVVNKSMADINMNGDKIAKSALHIPVIAAVPNNAKLFAHAANLQDMQAVLRHKDIRNSIGRIAKAIVGPLYKLSTDTTP